MPPVAALALALGIGAITAVSALALGSGLA